MPKNKKRADGRLQAKIYLGVEDGRLRYKYVYATTQRESGYSLARDWIRSLRETLSATGHSAG